STVDKGHGRITTGTVQVLPAPADLPFPGANQVFLIERYVTDTAGTPISAVAAFGVASPTSGQADPAALAAYVQGQRALEPHPCRPDTPTAEAHPPPAPTPGPRTRPPPRTPPTSAPRLAGRTDNTEATRWPSRNIHRPFTILGLTT